MSSFGMCKYICKDWALKFMSLNMQDFVKWTHYRQTLISNMDSD